MYKQLWGALFYQLLHILLLIIHSWVCVPAKLLLEELYLSFLKQELSFLYGRSLSSPSCVQQETDEKAPCANHADGGFQKPHYNIYTAQSSDGFPAVDRAHPAVRDYSEHVFPRDYSVLEH